MTTNYYEILEVDPRASADEIRASFRRKVKQHHPDRNPRNRQEAERQVRLVIEAYRVLSDPERRMLHDRRLRIEREQAETIWDRIRQKDSDPAALSRLMLHELLEGRGARGVEIYESLLRNFASFDLLPYLDLKDYLDAKFLLAEEYQRQGKLEVAVEMYREVYNEELEMPRLCFFFEEVTLRLRNLYLRDLVRGADPETALHYYSQALSMELPRTDKAMIWKRMAECYWKLGDRDRARCALDRAFHENPKVKGTRRIRERLGISLLDSDN